MRPVVGIGIVAAVLVAAMVFNHRTPAPQATAAPAARVPAEPAGSVAIFAGGCFWCTEADFDKVRGVLATTSGYIGGTVANPTYAQVSSKGTGHAEAVRIVFDPQQVSYEQLLDVYWRSIDPTTPNAQFCDHGSPYRSAIFAVDDGQLQAAQASRDALARSKPFPQPIVTQIHKAGPFYPAEDFHQDYHQRNPVRYQYYRAGCGRDQRLKQLWGDAAGAKAASAPL